MAMVEAARHLWAGTEAVRAMVEALSRRKVVRVVASPAWLEAGPGEVGRPTRVYG